MGRSFYDNCIPLDEQLILVDAVLSVEDTLILKLAKEEAQAKRAQQCAEPSPGARGKTAGSVTSKLGQPHRKMPYVMKALTFSARCFHVYMRKTMRNPFSHKLTVLPGASGKNAIDKVSTYKVDGIGPQKEFI